MTNVLIIPSNIYYTMKRFFYVYYKACRLPTAIPFNHLKYLIIIFLLSVICIFINDNLIRNVHNPAILFLFYICGLLYLIFLQCNIICRVNMLCNYGIPLLMKRKEYEVLLYYLLLNIIYVVLSLLVIFRLCLLCINIDPLILGITTLYTLCASSELYSEYLKKYMYESDYNEMHDKPINLKKLDSLILLALPLTLLTNILYNYSNLFYWIKGYFIVNAQPNNRFLSMNTNVQSNDNVQGSSSNESSNTNSQGNKNAQLNVNTNVSDNNQINSNQQGQVAPSSSKTQEQIAKILYKKRIKALEFRYNNDLQYTILRTTLHDYIAIAPYWDCVQYLSILRINYSNNDQLLQLIDSFTGDLIQKLNKNIINNIMFLHSPTVTLNSMNYLPVYLNKVYQIGSIQEYIVYNGIGFTPGRGVFHVEIYNQSTKELPFLNVNDYYQYAMNRIKNPDIREFITNRIKSVLGRSAFMVTSPSNDYIRDFFAYYLMNAELRNKPIYNLDALNRIYYININNPILLLIDSREQLGVYKTGLMEMKFIKYSNQEIGVIVLPTIKYRNVQCAFMDYHGNNIHEFFNQEREDLTPDQYDTAQKQISIINKNILYIRS